MKNFLILGLMVIALPAFGQKFNAGLFGGVSASQVDGDTYSGFKKLGLTAGAYVNREINFDIYWQLEIKYVMRGVYEGPTDANPNFLHRSVYHYIEFPLSAHYIWNDKIQAEGGFSPEVFLNYRSWDQDGLQDPESYPENRRFGLSVFGGIHYWYKPVASVGIRYTYSAFPFRDPQEWHNVLNRGFFHNVLALTLGYRFLHH
ncbi:MAG: outer membrane beta-barrel protein [Bacteroidales bacterium]|nr:outer membrane beta-barrel protein [Bacteroidales bacterium]MBN2699185.1 outer membrane beta-barrel protein [Bacteroidales bacterium]